MGTRADFYVGRGEQAEWLGSIAWDGYPGGLEDTGILRAVEESTFRAAVATLAAREDFTAPAKGWPWPWDDSRTTDYAYAFDGSHVWASDFGREWFDAAQPEPLNDDDEAEERPETAIFPNMRAKKNVAWDARSGIILLRVPKE